MKRFKDLSPKAKTGIYISVLIIELLIILFLVWGCYICIWGMFDLIINIWR